MSPCLMSNFGHDAVLSVSRFIHPRAMSLQKHIHNAVLAGGVAVGASCGLIPSPWLAMVLGLTAGLISIGGAKCLPVRSWAANTLCFGLGQQDPGTKPGHCVVPWAALGRHWHLLRLVSKLG